MLSRTAYPQEPSDVITRQPTAALAARAAAVGASTALLIGLVAITLTVAGIGIANVMIIAVLERRHEIGIRRALGARRAHIRRQFLTEAVLLSAAGATSGTVIGLGVTVAVAKFHEWPAIHPDLHNSARRLTVAILEEQSPAYCQPSGRHDRHPPKPCAAEPTDGSRRRVVADQAWRAAALRPTRLPVALARSTRSS